MNNTFRTIVEAPVSTRQISHSDTILTFGSCFGEHIGGLLETFQFKIHPNPTGILYNPLSIVSTLNKILSKKTYTKEDLFLYLELWRSFDFHSSFAFPDPDKSLEAVNESLNETYEFINKLDILIITFGTAIAYFLKKSGMVVANCHKLPPSDFDRRMIEVDSIVETVSEAFSRLYTSNPNIQIILTVSPVRHIMESARENQISKSTLHLAIHKLQSRFPVHYFPAYEIMMDDLRDYRFYKPDMIHPSETAIEYIWDAFIKSCVSDRSRKFIQEYAPINRALNHKIINVKLDATKNFAESNLTTLRSLSNRYPEINLSPATEYFSKLL